MINQAYGARVDDIKRRAHGRWNEVLASLQVDERILKRMNLPCPLCGGTDRFQYTDKFGEGNYHCRSCGPGGGFKLLQAVKGIDFNTALREVERCVGSQLPEQESVAADPLANGMKKLVQRLWDEARPIEPGDEVDRYLRGRGLELSTYPSVLRRHDALGFFEKDAHGKSRKLAQYPAMLACVQAPDGRAATLHRTYSPRCSCTMRTARSRTSGENLFDFFVLLMAPSSQRLEPPQNPGRFRQPPMKGRTNFEKGLRGLLASHRVHSRAEVQEIEVSGNLAYCWSVLDVEIRPVAGGDKVVRSGSALSILRKQDDGAWVLVRDANLLALKS